MFKNNPFFNAVGAAVYIAGIVLFIRTVVDATQGSEDTIVIPMMMLSLLVLSVAIMAFLFGYQPLRMYLDGNKQEALTFFAKTVGYFSCFVVIYIVIFLSAAR
ncbi:MAG: hypothetical protein AAB458_01675 [Patescibacteria group bacterium]